jgi:hypothetical protein
MHHFFPLVSLCRFWSTDCLPSTDATTMLVFGIMIFWYEMFNVVWDIEDEHTHLFMHPPSKFCHFSSLHFFLALVLNQTKHVVNLKAGIGYVCNGAKCKLLFCSCIHVFEWMDGCFADRIEYKSNEYREATMRR